MIVADEEFICDCSCACAQLVDAPGLLCVECTLGHCPAHGGEA